MCCIDCSVTKYVHVNNSNNIQYIRTNKKLVPELKPEEYQDLVESIAEFGQREPIIVNQDYVILDGHHRFNVCRDLGIQVKFEVREFDNELLEELFVIDANLARRQLTDYSRVTLLERVNEIYSELGKKAESEGGKKGNEIRWHPDKIGFTENSKPDKKIDTHKEIAEHANTSRAQATKIIYINDFF